MKHHLLAPYALTLGLDAGSTMVVAHTIPSQNWEGKPEIRNKISEASPTEVCRGTEDIFNYPAWASF
jgi:hypothetical protein